MSYRSGPCAFCDDEARAQCPRCGASTCATHAPAIEPSGAAHRLHCAICAKELKDNLDEVKFVRDLKQPGDDRSLFGSRKRAFSFSDVVDSIGDSLARALDARRARKIFDRRTAVDIAAWRKRADISVRGG